MVSQGKGIADHAILGRLICSLHVSVHLPSVSNFRCEESEKLIGEDGKEKEKGVTMVYLKVFDTLS